MSPDSFFITHEVSPQNKRVMQALHFDEKTLNENEGGILTLSQRQYLERRLREKYYDLFIPLLMMVGLMCAGILCEPSVSHQKMGLLPICGMLGICPVLLVCLVVSQGRSKILYDLKHNRVESAKGKVHVSLNSTDSIYSYRIYVRDCPCSFHVMRHVAEAFIEKDVYIVYYVSKSELLLAAEHVPEESPHLALLQPQGTRRERREKRERLDVKQKHR